MYVRLFFFNDAATTEIYTLSLHDALPISRPKQVPRRATVRPAHFLGSSFEKVSWRSEEHTSELQSLTNLVCRLLLEKKKAHWRFAPNAGDGRTAEVELTAKMLAGTNTTVL